MRGWSDSKCGVIVDESVCVVCASFLSRVYLGFFLF